MKKNGGRAAFETWKKCAMDMTFSPTDAAFREEVRDFLADNLPQHLRDGARRTPGVCTGTHRRHWR